jgi:hypothetical protein
MVLSLNNLFWAPAAYPFSPSLAGGYASMGDVLSHHGGTGCFAKSPPGMNF